VLVAGAAIFDTGLPIREAVTLLRASILH